ncbi:hypothetical protein [Cupriavidus sp. YR651]|nr:hypothetical protein [Cupriavidus sp. YR651]
MMVSAVRGTVAKNNAGAKAIGDAKDGTSGATKSGARRFGAAGARDKILR